MKDRRVLRFRVYPSGGSDLHALVHVYPTLSAMREAVRQLDRGVPKAERWPSRKRRRLGAQTAGITVRMRRTQRKLPVFAWIYFSRTELGIGTITHECVHAGLRWLARRGVETVGTSFEQLAVRVPNTEETLACAIDRMAIQVVHRCRRAGVIR